MLDIFRLALLQASCYVLILSLSYFILATCTTYDVNIIGN